MEQTTYILADGTELKSWETWGLVKTERTQVSPPIRRTKKIVIPGANGSVDLLKYFGAGPTYEERTLTDTYAVIKRHRKWEAVKSAIYAKLGGAECRIITDSDRGFYWAGTAAVTEAANGRDVLTLKITCSVFPYKYERFSSVEPWLWSPFSFYNGIIRNYYDLSVSDSGIEDYKGLAVSATRSLVIPCRALPVCPGFWTSSSGMTVTYGGVTKALTQRSSSQDPRVYEEFDGIVLPEGDQTLTFGGTGNVSVLYRGGCL